VKSKFIRIYPPYWLALSMFILVLGYSLKRFDFGVYAANLQFIFSPAVVKQMLTLWYVSIVAAYYAVFSILIVRGHSNLALPAWSVAVFLAAYAFHLATGLVDVRFFEYYFIFLAGIFFSRFAEIRERLSSLHFVYKIILAVLGAWLFWLVQAAGYKVTDVRYLLAVDFYILSWIWMWLGIFRTAVGGWKIWMPVSTASFFAYLYHRPMWEVLVTLFDVEPGKPDMLFKFLPGSLIVLIISYSMQRGYDRLIRLLKLSS
jgi:peptidoglycan/LPS O-acetylase OafA/YrhL